MASTPQIITLFSELKHGVNSSPVVTWFETDNPTFLKTGCISEGMGWIFMQPAIDK